jgi:hypothetical protein
MTERTYSFDESLAVGHSYEKALDAFLSPWFSIRPATSFFQKRGVDRIARSRKTDQTYWLEYKADTVAGRTGNAFIETVSVQNSEAQKLGWLYTTVADFVLYFVIDQALIYWLRPSLLRRSLPNWLESYALKTTTTKQGWQTTGVIVPLEVLSEIADYTMEYREG